MQLAKCLLAARGKGRVGQEIAKLTVDAPIPYLLSDLSQLVQAEMGKLDRAGDTAPYLQYSSVRIRSIFRKLDEPTPDFALLDASALDLAADEEVARRGELGARQVLAGAAVIA